MSGLQLEMEFGQEVEDNPPPPEVPDTRPEILKTVDDVIASRKDSLTERIRKIRNDEGVTFEGLTREQIQEHYGSLVLNGNENSAQMRAVQGRAATLRLEAGAHLRRAERKKKDIEDAYNTARSYVEGKIIAANITANRNEKISDKAREVLSRQVYEVGDPQELAMAVAEEIEWKGVVRDLDAFLKASESNAMLLMSENKAPR